MNNENVILEGVFKKFKVNKLFVFLYCVVAAGASVICFLSGRSQYNNNLYDFDSMWENLYADKAWWYEQHPIYTREQYALYTPLDDFFEQPMGRYRLAIIIPVVMLIVLIVTILILTIMRKQLKLTITDKRVYGKAGIIKRVDLPNDMISAIATHFKSGVSIATSSGKINFIFLENREEVFKVISEILSSRQSKKEAVPQIIEQAALSNADELKKYKDLMDSGVITQEEFDAKKKQLLGL